MCRFGQWLAHRAALLGIGSHAQLADAAGLPPEAIEAAATGSLGRVGRSARAWLARTLEVTVRDLEALAAGRIDWIADDQRVQFDRYAPAALRITPRPSAVAPVAQPCGGNRGVPVVGRIVAGGRVEFFSEFAAPDGPRLPLHFRSAPDAFALHASVGNGAFPNETSLVFRALPPGELVDDEIALLTRSDANGESQVCHVRKAGPMQLRLLSPGGSSCGDMLSTEIIVRAARVIGTHPPVNDHLSNRVDADGARL